VLSGYIVSWAKISWLVNENFYMALSLQALQAKWGLPRVVWCLKEGVESAGKGGINWKGGAGAIPVRAEQSTIWG